jgi:hypothetical protein
VKHFKLISILCVALGVSAAQAETKVTGEFFGNLEFELDNGKVGANDVTTGYGFTTERARIGATHSFNDTWALTLGVDGVAAASFNRAYITGKNWIADGHTMHFGKQQNAYQRMWEAGHARWIHADLTTEMLPLYTAYINGLAGAALPGTAMLSDYSGLNWNIAVNDMWQVEISLNNGSTSEFQGGTSTSMGYGLTVAGKFTENFGLLLGYDTFDAYNNTANDNADDVAPGLNALRASLNYMSDMIDAGLEYTSLTHNKEDGAAAVEGEDVDAQAIHATWKYAEGKGVFAKYTMSGSEDEIGLENTMTLGHSWALDKGVNTGLFYTASSFKNSDNDTSAIMWKWAAGF